MRQQIRPILRHLRQKLRGHIVDDVSEKTTVQGEGIAIRTLTSLFRAAFEFKNANSTATLSSKLRFVQSGNLASNAVRSCEGPCGASVGEPGGDVSLGVPGIGVAVLEPCASGTTRWPAEDKMHIPLIFNIFIRSLFRSCVSVTILRHTASLLHLRKDDEEL